MSIVLMMLALGLAVIAVRDRHPNHDARILAAMASCAFLALAAASFLGVIHGR